MKKNVQFFSKTIVSVDNIDFSVRKIQNFSKAVDNKKHNIQEKIRCIFAFFYSDYIFINYVE